MNWSLVTLGMMSSYFGFKVGVGADSRSVRGEAVVTSSSFVGVLWEPRENGLPPGIPDPRSLAGAGRRRARARGQC